MSEKTLSEKRASATKTRLALAGQTKTHPLAYRFPVHKVEQAHALAFARGMTLPEMVRRWVESEIEQNGAEVERGRDAMRAANLLD